MDIQVGVRLERAPDRLGDWLADAAAFDAAGADALWVDAGPELDVLTLAAALAAVTFRARLVVAVPETPPESPAPNALATVERLCNGRLARGDDDLAHWERVPTPESRAAWQETRADAVARGVCGLVVPAGPRLLDLLRNPDDPGERGDLLIAQG